MASGDATESRLVVAIRPRPLAGGVPPDGSLRFDCGTANAVACSSASSGTEEVLQFDRVFAPDAMNDDVYSGGAAGGEGGAEGHQRRRGCLRPNVVRQDAHHARHS